jgi:hypothetical protein
VTDFGSSVTASAMTEAPSTNMVLVYDLRRDRAHRERVLSQVQEQWQAYQRGG